MGKTQITALVATVAAVLVLGAASLLLPWFGR
jgi:hypothetical protein